MLYHLLLFFPHYILILGFCLFCIFLDTCERHNVACFIFNDEEI